MVEEKDLKAQNFKSLTAIYIGALFLVFLVHWGVDEVFALTNRLFTQTIVTGVITSFGALLSNILPNSMKHMIVFLRFRNVLSGHRCKTICREDPRLSKELLEKRWPELFVEKMKESEQNSFWYNEIYPPVNNAPEVLQAHRSFLLYRDSASGLFILMIGMLIWRVISAYVSLPYTLGWSLLPLVGVIILLGQAGRQSGNRMVANAVAVRLTSERKDR